METIFVYILLGWIGVSVVASGLGKLWPYLFPQKRCSHGVGIFPGEPYHLSVAGYANRCRQCRSDREAEQRRREEEANRKLEQLRVEYAENIRQLTYLQEMDPLEFERVVSHAFRTLGWDVEDTPGSGDRGVDAYLRQNGKTIILQCKRISSGRVGTPVLRDLLGTITAEDADGGIVATTSSFSEQAIEWARNNGNIELIDGHRLVELIASAYPLGSPVPEDFITRRRHPAVVPSRCPSCGAKTKRVKGRYGPFYGCTAFPSCRWTMPAPGRGYRVVRR